MDDKVKVRPWYCPDIREILALIVVVGGGYILYTAPKLEATMGVIFGYVLGYYFGSSTGSKEKTELLAKANAIEEKKCCRSHD